MWIVSYFASSFCSKYIYNQLQKKKNSDGYSS